MTPAHNCHMKKSYSDVENRFKLFKNCYNIRCVQSTTLHGRTIFPSPVPFNFSSKNRVISVYR